MGKVTDCQDEEMAPVYFEQQDDFFYFLPYLLPKRKVMKLNVKSNGEAKVTDLILHLLTAECQVHEVTGIWAHFKSYSKIREENCLDLVFIRKNTLVCFAEPLKFRGYLAHR